MSSLNEEVALWMRYAVNDLDTARLLRDHGFFAEALFHTQQAVEKSLKALYIAEVDAMFPRVHALAQIAERTAVPREWFPFLRELTTKYSESRYPNFPVESPSELYDLEYTSKMMTQAEELLTWIQRQLSAT